MKRVFVFNWTTFNGGRIELSLSSCTKEEAIRRALEWGWTPPKWWQWWRWGDTPREIPNT